MDADIRAFIAKKLRMRRAELHIDQIVIAERAGMSQQALARLEKGTVEPRAGTLYRLAIALEVTPEYFYPAVQAEEVEQKKAMGKR